MIPVSPAAHYSCGGIKTDEWGRSSIKNLFAAGECASTGLHGANRLASNSLLEAMVFAHRCYVASAASNPSVGEAHLNPPEGGILEPESKTITTNKTTSLFSETRTPQRGAGGLSSAEAWGLIPDWNAEGTTEPKEMILITQSLKEVQQVMSDYVGIVRNDIRLQRALRRLDLLWEETEQLYQTSTLSPQLLELRNMITVSYLIVKSAAFRKESRGLHYNTDYPGKSPLVQNIVL
jgi:L-aspartate oxidase